jgi:hypothetical protein
MALSTYFQNREKIIKMQEDTIPITSDEIVDTQ